MPEGDVISVEDAKRAGVHPMAALGINASSFSPVQATFQTSPGMDYSFIDDLGQNISREAMAGKDREARAEAKAYQDTVNAMTLEKMGLENDLLRSEIASLNARTAQQLTPPAPVVNATKSVEEDAIDGTTYVMGKNPGGDFLYFPEMR